MKQRARAALMSFVWVVDAAWFYVRQRRVRIPPAWQALAGRRLRELTYVAFDTETTGLKPSQGDEIVSVAGVRIVGGRMRADNVFDRLVDPGRPIPERSVRIHGVSDDMVRGEPPASVVLEEFRTFCDGAALVAHNAAFDMAFLKRNEADNGTEFGQPVLDILLLSAYLHDHAHDHAFDAVAARFGIEVDGRHTALGDATAVAEIFVRMIAELEDCGIHTLGDALAAANSMVWLRHQQQSRYQ